MSRYLSTIPDNIGFYNLGTVWNYPTGGTGPTAYGPTSYYGSDPLPANGGDSINNPVDLGDFSSQFRTVTLKSSSGGLTRKQSTFYHIRLHRARSIQFTQNYSQFSYTNQTNRNTLLAFYKVVDGTHRVELPINDSGYVYTSTGVDYDSDEYSASDFPDIDLPPGDYIFLITNDIRYLETEYSFNVNVAILDWRFVYESVDDSGDFGQITDNSLTTSLDFGSLAA